MVNSIRGYIYSMSDIIDRYEYFIKKYMAQYRLSVTNLRGSQGEMAKMDFQDGDDIIRIWLCNEVEKYKTYSDDDWWSESGIAIRVERFKDAKPDRTLWFGEGELMDLMCFYIIGKDRYADWEEANRINQVQEQRRKARYVQSGFRCLDDRAKPIVLSYIQKQYRCKSKKLSDIWNVCKYIEKGSTYYSVSVCGKNYFLGGVR